MTLRWGISLIFNNKKKKRPDDRPAWCCRRSITLEQLVCQRRGKLSSNLPSKGKSRRLINPHRPILISGKPLLSSTSLTNLCFPHFCQQELTWPKKHTQRNNPSSTTPSASEIISSSRRRTPNQQSSFSGIKRLFSSSSSSSSSSNRRTAQGHTAYRPTYDKVQDGPACRIYGSVQVKKVTANLHITTLGHGYMSFQHTDHHCESIFSSHIGFVAPVCWNVLKRFWKINKVMNLSHVVHEFSFGPFFPAIAQPLDQSYEITQQRKLISPHPAHNGKNWKSVFLHFQHSPFSNTFSVSCLPPISTPAAENSSPLNTPWRTTPDHLNMEKVYPACSSSMISSRCRLLFENERRRCSSSSSD